MTRAARPALYSPRLLGLAVELADHPFDEKHAHIATERSRTCGSRIDMSVGVTEEGTIADLGMRVSACAVGQAAAAIFAGDAKGKTGADIDRAAGAIALWLRGDGEMPAWKGIEALEPALPHAGRHEAILLPWKAARTVLCNPAAPR